MYRIPQMLLGFGGPGNMDRNVLLSRTNLVRTERESMATLFEVFYRWKGIEGSWHIFVVHTILLTLSFLLHEEKVDDC